jgi:hypothetical protein
VDDICNENLHFLKIPKFQVIPLKELTTEQRAAKSKKWVGRRFNVKNMFVAAVQEMARVL